jgi:hypothetical protein
MTIRIQTQGREAWLAINKKSRQSGVSLDGGFEYLFELKLGSWIQILNDLFFLKIFQSVAL